MPLDPRVLLLGLQPQARTPYDAQDLVAERRAHVEQLREAAKAKQEAEYETQLYDWAVKSNLGPDGTPDFEGVRKSLAQVAPRTLQKFDAAMNTAKKSTLETQKLQDDHRAALTGWAGSAFNNADETNYGDIFPVVQKGAPELVKQYGLTGDYQHDKGAIGAVRSAATSMPEQLKAAEEARGHVLKNEWDLAAAKKLDALATSGQLTDDTLVSGLNELRDVGMPTSVYQRWNIPLEKAAALAKNIQITPEQRVQAQQATDTLDETKRAHDLEQQARDAAAKRADLSAGALDAYRKARLAQGANRPAGGGAGAAGGLTPDAVDYVATQYRILGPSGMPTRISEADRTAVLNKSAEQVKLLGQSPAIAVQRQAAYKSDATSLTKMRSMAAAAESFETKANQQADIVNDLSTKVGRTGSPMLNSWLLAGKKEVAGDTDTALLYNAIQTFSTEYAKIMEGSTGSAAGSSDSARKASENLIKAAMAPATIPKVVSLMQREMALTRTGYDATIEHITNRMGGTVPPEAKGGTTVPSPVQSLLASQPAGKYTLSDGTVWQKDAAGTVTQVK